MNFLLNFCVVVFGLVVHDDGFRWVGLGVGSVRVWVRILVDLGLGLAGLG